MKDIITSSFRRSIETKEAFLARETDSIQNAAQLIVSCFRAGNHFFLCGNGGSASDAQHIATELTIRYKSGNERVSLPAISLSSDSGALTACGNDYGFDQVFSRQLEGLGRPGDVLLGISTSGNSPTAQPAALWTRCSSPTEIYSPLPH